MELALICLCSRRNASGRSRQSRCTFNHSQRIIPPFTGNGLRLESSFKSIMCRMSIDYRRYQHEMKDWLLSNAIHAPMAEASADVSRSKVLADVLMYPIRR